MYRERLQIMIDQLDEKESEQLINIIEEYWIAKEKHPIWPTDIIHRAAIVNEEAGELIRAALRYHYEDALLGDMELEAIQTGAMAFRFLVNVRS